MWRTLVLVLLCFTSTLAQVPDVSSSDVLVKADEEADRTQYQEETEDDLWAEDGLTNYEYDWDSWDTDKEDVESVPVESVESVEDPLPAVEDKEEIMPDDSVGTPGTAADEPVDIIDELNDWDDDKFLTNDELYDGQAGDYSSEKEEYPSDLSEYEDLQNWPDADEEDSDDSESSEESDKLAPTPQLEEYGASMVVEGRKRGVFTVWHYAIFAIAGAIFILGIVIIVGAAIKAARRPNSSYRRLADPVKV